jgi:signal transduction histidine kinase
VWRSGELAHTREVGDLQSLGVVSPPSQHSAFFLDHGARGSALHLGESELTTRRAVSLSPGLAELLGDAPVLGVSLRGESVNGWLLLSGVQDIASDDLRLAGLVGRQAADALEQFALSRELQLMSAADERVRVSRDLHDGVLQTLSGIALRLTSVRKSADTVEETREQLRDLEQLLLDEQRSLRSFTEELRTPQSTGGRFAPADALVGLVQRLERIWSIQILWDPMEAESVPPALASDVYRLVHEAVVNSARHGHAKTVRLELRRDHGRYVIAAADDGTGFPFEGRFTLAEMRALKRGPLTLRERVEGLHGDLIVSSSAAGASVEIALPCPGV